MGSIIGVSSSAGVSFFSSLEVDSDVPSLSKFVIAIIILQKFKNCE